MSNEIATRDLAGEKDFAVALSASDLIPRQYAGKPANVLVAMEWARALGVPPMVAMQQLFILDGKPSASAAMIAGLVRRAGHNLRVFGTDTEATCEIVRHDDPEFTFRATWTITRATTAGLTGKGTWKQYPNAMLKARAITEAARDACPEALLGVQYTPEELERATTPPPAPVPPAHDTNPPADEDGVVVEADIVEVEVFDELPGEVTRVVPDRDEDPYYQPPTGMHPHTANMAASQKQLGAIRGISATLGVGQLKAGDLAHWVLKRDAPDRPDGLLLTKAEASAVIEALQGDAGKALAQEFLGTLV